MKGLFCGACSALVLLIGCTTRNSEDARVSTGTLAMRLSTELNGVTYQLSAASFDVSGRSPRR